MTTAVATSNPRVNAEWIHKHANPMGTTVVMAVPQIGHDLVVMVTDGWGEAETGKLFNLGRVRQLSQPDFGPNITRTFRVRTSIWSDQDLEVRLADGISTPEY